MKLLAFIVLNAVFISFALYPRTGSTMFLVAEAVKTLEHRQSIGLGVDYLSSFENPVLDTLEEHLRSANTTGTTPSPVQMVILCHALGALTERLDRVLVSFSSPCQISYISL